MFTLVLGPSAQRRRARAGRSALPASSSSSGDIGSLRRPASPRANSDAMPCESDQICSAIISDRRRAAAGMAAMSASVARAEHARRRGRPPAAVPGWCRAECRPRTWPSSRRARCGRTRDRPCRAARTPRTARAGRRPRRASSAASNCSKPRRATLGQELVAVAEMPIGRGRTDARPARGFCEGEPGRPLLGDQLERGAHQRLFQIAVMVAARAAFPFVTSPAHVNSIYIVASESSIAPTAL